MKNIFVFLCWLTNTISVAQIYLSDYANQIYQFDPLTCTFEFLFEVGTKDTLRDLAIRSDGQIYGITNNGDLYQINPQTEDALLIHSFLNLQTFEALYFSSDGQMYVSGSEGFLYSFEISTKSERFLGDLGNISVEDMVQHAGNLYASTNQNKLVHINLIAPSQSEIIMDLPGTSSLEGLYTAENLINHCEVLSFFGVSALGKVYKVDTKSKEVTEICEIGFNVSGATSSQDLTEFTPLVIQNFVTHSSQCSADNGEVSIQASGGSGKHQYSINDGAYIPDSIMVDLAPGNYTINVRDENNCTISQNMQIELTEYPVIEEIKVNKPICLEGKGSISILAGGITTLDYSLDGTNFQKSENFTAVTGGIYSIWVRDSNGCQAMGKIDLIPNESFQIDKIHALAASCDSQNGSIEVSLVVNYPDLTYQLDDQIQATGLFESISAGMHNLSVIQGTDCRIDTVVLLSSERCEILCPMHSVRITMGSTTIFASTPVRKMKSWLNLIRFFDRWGGKIYEATNFSIHEENHWWDGHFNESNITQGLYVYVIDLAHQDGSVEHLQGQLSIL
ncbi:MAG: gliding motility-associated C-terminal domain-containing protein [Saprospiraceae bacterium]|nr:gliding motility-associated C-terminal domain-containing protein [Saprospiraceae bacterium]